MGSRNRPARTQPIRVTLSALLVVPLVSLVALWGFAASVTLGDEFAKRNYDTLNRTFNNDSGTAVAAGVAQERALSFARLSSGGRMPRTALDAERTATDAALPAFSSDAMSSTAQGALDSTAKHDLAVLLGKLHHLDSIRSEVDANTVSAVGAFEAYDDITDTYFRFFTDMASLNDISIYRQGLSNLNGAHAAEMVGREAGLVFGALAAGGRMTPAEHGLFAQFVGSQRFLESELLAEQNPVLRAPYERLLASPTYLNFRAMEDRIVSSTGKLGLLPVNGLAFEAGAQAVATTLENSAIAGGKVVAADAKALGNTILLRLALVGGAGLAGVLVSIFLLLRFGRRISRELRGLQQAALELAEHRLPWVVGRLSRGEDVDASAEAPPLTPGRTTEIAKVARAFSSVQSTAVEAAVGQANLRKDVNRVFLNLARRSQSLLHRQLDMLDSMERATADPQAMEDFFRLDHLTTRMRRHAENLIILSGEPPGRGWREPVPIVDVIRGAVAEIEDYVRVEVICDAQDAVVGAAVADVIHLLAELIENATAYSPPNTKVMVTADRVGNGFAVEIEDRGLGIEPGEMAEINKRLADPPELDLADSDRLGLFVVGQLAARHQVRISLLESPFCGTTAVVLLPHSMVVPEDQVRAHAGPADEDIPGPPGTEPSPATPHTMAAAADGAVARYAGDGGEGRGVPSADPILEPAGASTQPVTGRHAPGAPAVRQQADSEDTYLGLPRRIRQASLAPELRDGMPPEEGASSVLSAPTPLSPEEARTRMASMQRGWQRGRSDQAEDEFPAAETMPGEHGDPVSDGLGTPNGLGATPRSAGGTDLEDGRP